MINVKYTITYFNSQPHEEADGQIRRCVKREQYFNSQPHEEADEQRKAEEKARLHFNSQPHEEADDYEITCDSAEPISTHSLTKRLTKREVR